MLTNPYIECYPIPKISMTALPRSKIAVVDDEEELALLYSEALDAAGYDTNLFSDSKLALEKISLNHSHYIMVMSDNRMPGLSGLDLFTQIRRKDDKIKFLLASAYPQVSRTNLGFTFLEKPFRISSLLDTVRAILRPEKSNLLVIES
jgi:two-component system C4-dicarboxylate transport response regulator DctD